MKTEKILFILFLIGIAFRLMHWPGGAVMHLFSLAGLALIYFPGSFYFYSDKSIKNQNIPLSIITGFFLSIIPVGVLFKVLYWPGAQINLLVGTVSAIIIYGIVIFLQSKAEEDLKTYYKNMKVRTTVLMVAGLLFYLTPTATLLKIEYWDDPEFARITTLHYANPENEEYHEEYRKQLKKREFGAYYEEYIEE